MDIPGIIMKGLGVGPDDVRNMIASVVKERDAMRAGFQNLAAHFNARLDTIEKQQAEILRYLDEAQNGKQRSSHRRNGSDHPDAHE
jgi:Skp family chaperone for outer membrane proteins